MLDLSIVIVNYNTGDLLRECLRSLFASEGDFTYQVTVVDNHSQDGSAALVRREFPQVDLLENPENVGYAQANNQGLKSRKARYYLLLNPDTVLPPGALRGMLSFMEEHPQAGIAGPKLMMADSRLDLACRRSFPTPEVSFYRLSGLGRLFPKSKRFGRYNLTYLDPDQEAEVDSVVGAFMMIRGETLEEVGYLDEEFFLYGEDLDFAYRAKKAGWKVYYYPQVTVVHYKRRSSSQNRKRAQHEFYRAMHLFYRKHYAKTTPLWLHWLVMIGIILRGGTAMVREVLQPPGDSKQVREVAQ
ncbi:MAG: glycosyltransferase family 2 protein [Chloroflexota bacterium]|nr:glycosyltransferase family 2 protein [Chloroflexota bacterium]